MNCLTLAIIRIVKGLVQIACLPAKLENQLSLRMLRHRVSVLDPSLASARISAPGLNYADNEAR